VTTLDALESANEELCERLLVHFLWRWADFLGIQPHIDCCAGCGEDNNNAPLWLNTREGTALCTDCVKSSQPPQLQQLSPGSRRWLAAVGMLEPSSLHRYSMDKKSFNEAKSFVTAVLTATLGKRLTSWSW
jgi:DNA repair protein RecO (recombination protein O)